MMHIIRHNENLDRIERFNQLKYSAVTTTVEPSVFHALQPPSITPIEYFRRLVRFSFSSPTVFITAFYYLERIALIPYVDLRLNSLSVHRLVLTAVLLATKFVDDVLYDNAHFAKVGGLDVNELNMLELDLLKVLDFKLFVHTADLNAFEQRVLATIGQCHDPDYAMLQKRLRNLGYFPKSMSRHSLSLSPTSSMEVIFDPSK